MQIRSFVRVLLVKCPPYDPLSGASEEGNDRKSLRGCQNGLGLGASKINVAFILSSMTLGSVASIPLISRRRTILSRHDALGQDQNNVTGHLDIWHADRSSVDLNRNQSKRYIETRSDYVLAIWFAIKDYAVASMGD